MKVQLNRQKTVIFLIVKKMKFLMKNLVVGLLLSTCKIVNSAKEAHEIDVLQKPQELENYSFDFSNHHLPIAYNTFGASTQLMHKYKLIPDVKNRYGAIVLNKVRNSNL